jgi:hypothetical protein
MKGAAGWEVEGWGVPLKKFRALKLLSYFEREALSLVTDGRL